MMKSSKWILSWLLWTWGGANYFMLEVIYKTLTGNAQGISWTMLVLSFVLCIPIERCGCELPWEVPLLLQALICATVVTFAEFATGVVLNLWLQLSIWDYSQLPGNILGQVCPQFFVLWYLVCLVFIPVFDWLRYVLKQGERPHYTFVKFLQKA